MAQEIAKVNGIAFADIEKINGKTDTNIENLNGFEFSAPSFGPPEVDAVSVNTVGTGPYPTQTSAHTVGTGVGRGLIVAVCQTNTTGAGSPALPSVTYDGVSMTQIYSQYEYEHLRISVWYLINPNSGGNNIVATFGATTGGASSIRGISFTGLNQSSMVQLMNSGSYNVGSATSLGPASIDSVAGQFVVDFIAIGDGDATPPSSLAKHSGTGTDIGSIASLHAGRYVEATGSSQAMGWTWTGGANWVWMCVRVLSDVYS